MYTVDGVLLEVPCLLHELLLTRIHIRVVGLRGVVDGVDLEGQRVVHVVVTPSW